MRDEYEKKLRKTEGQLELTKISLQQAVREKQIYAQETQTTFDNLTTTINALQSTLQASSPFLRDS